MTRAKSPYVSRATLETMLTEGWRIQPPVYVRPRWRWASKLKRRSAYHFVLERRRGIRLVSVLEGSEIRQLVDDSQLSVDCV